VPATAQAPALGSAIAAAVTAGKARGGHDSFESAIAAMASEVTGIYRPISENVTAYERLYKEYKLLREYFGCGGNDVMMRLFDMAEEERSM